MATTPNPKECLQSPAISKLQSLLFLSLSLFGAEEREKKRKERKDEGARVRGRGEICVVLR